ncbi:MAG: penicillin acylase family protein [Bdellovibrionales bacterium]
MKLNPKNALALIPLILWVGLVWGLSRNWGVLPAIGPVFNPFSGLWQTPKNSRLQNREWSLSDLNKPVTVFWDEYRVPHILAENERDLAWAQGFVHASQRLFQMDLQARAGGARLSGLVGARTLSMDQFYIRLGLRHAVRQSLAMMMNDPVTKTQIEAYAEGVNAWIRTRTKATLPTEYRLMNVWPEPWSAQHAAEFFVLMSYRLSGRTFDVPLTWIQKKYGTAAARDLFPEFMPKEYEIPIYAGVRPKGLKPLAADKSTFVSDLEIEPTLLQPFVSNGSNNWAVGPKRSQTGVSLLANDTHLGFSMPGIWFEQQLLDPKTNVYGGGFAGAPGVMSGFTPGAAWAVTNGTTDVVDWYQIRFRDEEGLDYQTSTGWKAAQVEEEVIEVRGGDSQKLAVPWTDLGPLFHREKQKGLVVRWTLHEGSDAIAVFRDLNRAQSYQDCKIALSRFRFPIQNFICADSRNIGIQHAGLIPRRARGQGQFIMDAMEPNARWGSFLTSAEWPQIENPATQFVSSANQRPVEIDFPISMGSESENYYRGRRIWDELSRGTVVGFEDFVRLQTDVLNPLARAVLPDMVKLLSMRNLNDNERVIASQMAVWDYKDTIHSGESSVFSYWWTEFRKTIWADQLGESGKALWPRDERLELLVKRHNLPIHPDQRWIDDQNTPQTESLSDQVTASFKAALQALSEQFGPSMGKWSWGLVRTVNLPHVGRIPGFEVKVRAPGSKYSVNAMQSQHGPSWRMIVSMGPWPEAITSVQGASGGEPLSVDYDGGAEGWASGFYKQVLFIKGEQLQHLKQPGRYFWRLQPKGNP